MDKLTEILGLSVHDMGNDMEQKAIYQNRKEFEQFMKRRGQNSDKGGYRDYLIDTTQYMWEAWKAARGIKE